MTNKPEPVGTKPAAGRTPRPTPSIVVEDHTDEDTRAEILEVIAAWQWVQRERAHGHEPN